MHTGYVPCERPPLSAINFCSGVISFSQITKIFYSGAYHFKFFATQETIIFKISLTLNMPEELHFYGLCVYYVVQICDFGMLRVNNSRPECQPDASYSQFQRPSLSCTSLLRSPPPHIYAWARSGAPHFALCRGTYLPKFGVPPPPGFYHIT